MRYKSLGVFSGTFHSNSLSRKSTFPKALVAGGTRVGYEEVLPPCGHLLELHLPTSAYWHLQFTRGAVNDCCSQERSCGGYCRNQFQTKPTFKKPTVTGKISSHPLRKKRPNQPKDKILHLPTLLQEECQSTQQEVNSHLTEWPS